MGYKHCSIRDAINEVKENKLVLPALQRNYVWDESKIILLFDSLMKGYPIGAFLYWEVEGADLTSYCFHEFVNEIDYIEKDDRGVECNVADKSSVIAVLDGQQRITSMYTGLTGTYRSRVKSNRKENGEYPKRYLALNLLHDVANTNEDQYEFEFLSIKELQKTEENEYWDDDHYWFQLSKIMEPDFPDRDIYEFVHGLNVSSDSGKEYIAVKMLEKLYKVIVEEDNISYYKAIKKSLSEAVNIFSRINNSGKTLSGTDLMLSVASAGRREDMHNKINEAIKQVTNATDDEIGFVPDRDFILTAMLMATGAEKISTTNNDNYLPESISRVNDNWEKVVDAITAASIYIEKLGFNGKKIGKSFMHPIAYYFFKRGNIDPKQYYESSKPEAKSDRTDITQWLLRAQIKGIFAYGTPATLQDIRRVMDGAMVGTEKNKFPFGALMAQSQKPLGVTESDVKEIINWKYGDSKIVPLFTVLFNETIGTFDVDHLWPQSKMSTDSKIKKAAGEVVLQQQQIDFFKDNYNLLANLQLLRRTPNIEKNSDYYSEWIKKTYPNPGQKSVYIMNSCIPEGISYSFENFEEFYKARKELLIKKLKEYFDVSE